TVHKELSIAIGVGVLSTLVVLNTFRWSCLVVLGGVVVVSHDRALLADLADSVLSLDPTPDGRPRLYGDGYTGYRDRSAAERIQWEQEYAREQVEHAKLQDDLQAAQDRLV